MHSNTSIAPLASLGFVEPPAVGTTIWVKEPAQSVVAARFYLNWHFHKPTDVCARLVMGHMSGCGSQRHGVRAYFPNVGKPGFVALEELVGSKEKGAIEAHAAGPCDGNCKFVARWGDSSSTIVHVLSVCKHGGGMQGEDRHPLKWPRLGAFPSRKSMLQG